MSVSTDKIIRDAKQLAEDVREYMGEEGAHEVKQFARERAEEIKSRAVHAGRQIDRKARENVWATVGIAAATGAVLGFLASSKKGCNCRHCQT